MRVAFCSSFSAWGSWSPDFFFNPEAKGMVAGGETAFSMLAFQLAARGHEVMAFYDCDKPQHYRGVDWLPRSFQPDLITTLKFDALISFEDLSPLAMRHTADLTVLAYQNNQMTTGILDYSVDHYQAVSQWHVAQLKASDSTLLPSSDAKWVVFPNGIDPARYTNPPKERVPYRVIHSSSPDRGLHHLVRIWPEVRRAVPQAELHIFYELQRWFDLVALRPDLTTSDRGANLKALLHAQEGNGVVVHGAVNQWRLAQEQMAASLCVYPCDPIQPTEGFSGSILEALAAGTPVITTDADAFPELWAGVTRQLPLPFENKEDSWVRAIAYLLTEPGRDDWTMYSDQGRRHAAQYTWDRIGADYEAWLVGALAEKRAGIVHVPETLTPAGV